MDIFDAILYIYKIMQIQVLYIFIDTDVYAVYAQNISLHCVH